MSLNQHCRHIWDSFYMLMWCLYDEPVVSKDDHVILTWYHVMFMIMWCPWSCNVWMTVMLCAHDDHVVYHVIIMWKICYDYLMIMWFTCDDSLTYFKDHAQDSPVHLTLDPLYFTLYLLAVNPRDSILYLFLLFIVIIIVFCKQMMVIFPSFAKLIRTALEILPNIISTSYIMPVLYLVKITTLITMNKFDKELILCISNMINVWEDKRTTNLD